MKSAKAVTKYMRSSPRKVRLVARIIRGMSVEDAQFQLIHSNSKGGGIIKKALDSAVANAENQLNIGRHELSVWEVRVDAGPVLKRSHAKAKGGVVPILKRTSHVTVVVGSVRGK